MTGLISCAGLLLAAGEGKRFGGDKLGALVDGETVLALSASALASTDCILRAAVVGPATLHHTALLERFGYEVIVNADASTGMSTSVRRAVAWAEMRGADAALLALADMPFVTPTHLSRLAAQFKRSKNGIAYSRSGAKRSPPALFAASWFETLQMLEGDVGARALLAAASDDDGVVAPAWTFADIDSQDSLARSSR